MPIFIVAFIDDKGLYAAAFSTLAKAKAFVDVLEADDATIVESEIDMHTPAVLHAFLQELKRHITN